MACTGTGMRGQEKLPTISPFELGYSIRSWTMDDGLKGPYVGAFAQARDGALLFSDGEGLIRYNGIELEDLFESAGPSVPRTNVLAIHEDDNGRLWTVGLSGQAMRESDGRWIPIGIDRGGRGGVGKFARGPDGRLWCAVSGNETLFLSVYEDGRFRAVAEKKPLLAYVQEMDFDTRGQLWLSVASQGEKPGVYRLEGDSLVAEVAKDWRIGTLFRKKDDSRPWLVTPHGIRVRERDSWNEVLAFSGPLPDPAGFSACVADEDGNYWIASRTLGLWVCQPDGQLSRLVNEEVKFPNLVRDLFTGRDGTIWFNGENGLLQLRRQPFTPWPQSQKHRRAAIRAMAEAGDGTLWFGGAGVYSLRPGEFVRAYWEDDTTVPNVLGILGNPQGGAWFATNRGGLDAISRRGQQIVAKERENYGQFLGLAYHDGDPWLGRARGLQRLQNGGLVIDQPGNETVGDLECLAAGSEVGLYASFRSRGLFHHKDGSWVFAGLPPPVRALTVSPDDTIWARRGDLELCWLKDGHWHRADGGEMGIPPQFQLVCSRDGSIWFQGSKGPIVRIDRKAAESWLQGDRTVDLQVRSYGKSEGLPAEQASEGPLSSTLMEDSGGRIWVATVQGVCAWHPSHDAHRAAEAARTEPIPVLIERVLVDDDPVPELGVPLTMKPDEHRLEIRYAGLDLANPERVTYRYRLSGYEDEWIDVGNRNTAYLQRMPPGTYRFQVTAADRNGVWNEEGASLAITVLPNWWEHGWFRFGTPAVFMIALLGIAYLRIQSVRRQAREQAILQDEFSRGLIEAQEAERARIAGELHDDLGQDLLVMKSRIDLARRRSDSDADQETLRQVSESTAEVLRKVRNLSHQLRPLHLDHLGLAASVRNLVKEVAESAGLDFEVDADDLGDSLSPEAVVGFYRILQEALNNVLKHAGANSVKVSLHRDGNDASLVVSDDGCGFETGTDRRAPSAPGHDLKAMRERCSLIGGNLDVISGPGEGTLVRIRTPLQVRGES